MFRALKSRVREAKRWSWKTTMMRFKIIYNALLFTLMFAMMAKATELSMVVTSGHSHNDYQQTRPLWDAIENRFISIEVDIHLVGQALLVGHDEEDLNENLTLQSLYLDPLRAYVNENNGWVYPEHELILLIDIKSSPEPTYQALRKELVKYADILTTYTSYSIRKRAVSVIISGNRPRELMQNEHTRYATYDGRIQDLNSEIPSNLVMLISDDWEEHFAWRGKGSMSKEDRNKLMQIIDRAHSNNYKIRFWNLPTNNVFQRDAVWEKLIEFGVDLITVDNLKAYREFFSNKRAHRKLNQ